jgi:Magnesium chelatase, subunit ChlI
MHPWQAPHTGTFSSRGPTSPTPLCRSAWRSTRRPLMRWSRHAEPDGGGLIITSSSCAGPPWAGKSMLARRLTTILPDMTVAEAIETTRIHSVTGLTGGRTAWVTIRPCHARVRRSRMSGWSRMPLILPARPAPSGEAGDP